MKDHEYEFLIEGEGWDKLGKFKSFAAAEKAAEKATKAGDWSGDDNRKPVVIPVTVRRVGAEGSERYMKVECC